ncbi:MAG TPA: efflux RND transporter periplasmic adaptor subunit [Longimicrobiales bacterium]|nr:efflux RND transporter periplasmic adaptor subunit [Longimicrobiales bacterium]
MRIGRQALFSAGIIGSALVVAAAFTLRGTPAQQGDTGGHVHGAAGAGDDAARPVQLSSESARRIGVTYTTVVRRALQPSVRLVGTIAYDETRLHSVNPKIEGWVERLHVDFTGAPVRAGEPLLAVYSPMLVSAQEELLLARRLVDEAAAGGSERAAATARDLLESARRRLRYWDIADADIARIEQRGTPQRTFVLRSPRSGLVVEKLVVEGMRIMPGMDIYRLADLSTVWVEGEVFEKDLGRVGVGQAAHITLDAYPGEMFRGRVQYVYPTVTPESRTGRVRVALANPGNRLKPGMYANLTLESAAGVATLTVPRSAIHFTGERALVFVREADGSLVPHVVTTGFTQGDWIEILAGLSEGEQVVSSANFLIDAESNMGSALGAFPDVEAHGTGTAAGRGGQKSPAGATDHSDHTVAPATDPRAGHR